ncbi:MAG: molybdenum ABC transporter ATP-binding protein [Burkholderiales bacterium]|nr:molybdenum ABC transporter ATP-binding protein [Burkholderiales bacterium]MCE7876300.1 molybdenum ABC transporter ATP-binding protein [Betaproteobacteria bacterium PRO3]
MSGVAPRLDVALRGRLGSFGYDVAFASPGSVTALFGPSGAGKSSIASAIAGIVRPDEGHVRLDGTVFFDAARGVNVPPHRRGIGYVFQDARLFPHLSVERNLRFGLERARDRAVYAAFDDVVSLLAIGPLLGRKPRGLSGGERQRVALGRALLGQPKLLVLDEPLASLDAGHRGEILPYLTGLRDAYSVPMVYVSHTIDEVVRLATHVVLVARGGVVATGPVEEIFSRADLRAHTGRRFEASSIVDATVVAHREEWHLTEVALGRARLAVPAVDAPSGTRLRLRIRARDVALAHREPVDSSITGRLPGHVAEIVPRDGPYAEVRVDIGSASVWALVTRQSVDRMGLAIGMPIWCLVKTVALDNRLVSPAPPA